MTTDTIVPISDNSRLLRPLLANCEFPGKRDYDGSMKHPDQQQHDDRQRQRRLIQREDHSRHLQADLCQQKKNTLECATELLCDQRGGIDHIFKVVEILNQALHKYRPYCATDSNGPPLSASAEDVSASRIAMRLDFFACAIAR